ncbi:MAG: N-acetylneuraminate synthase family protein [Pseudodesulfovibrio sp.]|nr:N-acetylneuraminate synthase family protein [Pseudodesulfovibrio sp.]
MAFNNAFKIGKRKVGIGCPVYLIAEIGRNHNADMNLAKAMVDAALDAGADAVKFQSFKAETLLIKELPKVSHIQETSSETKSAYESTREVELLPENHAMLKEYVVGKGGTFLSTPEDHSMVKLLNDLDIPVFKIASLDIVYLDLVEAIAATGKPIILSTGMSTLGEVEKALNILEKKGVKDVVVLHCTSNYPPRYEDVNLNAMQTIARAFDVPVGYSDHTPSIGVSIAAVALGACVIERHFTSDKTLPGPDQRLSLTPFEFKQMAEEIRSVERALGSTVKRPVEAEMEMRRLHRRRLVAAGDLKEGQIIKREDIACKCSEFGLDPEYIPFLVGRKASRDIPADAPLNDVDTHA